MTATLSAEPKNRITDFAATLSAERRQAEDLTRQAAGRLAEARAAAAPFNRAVAAAEAVFQSAAAAEESAGRSIVKAAVARLTDADREALGHLQADVQREHSKLLGTAPSKPERAAQIAARLRELTEALRTGIRELQFESSVPAAVATLRRKLGVSESPKPKPELVDAFD